MPKDVETKRAVVRIAGKLREIITVQDEKGRILHKMTSPLMLEFYPRDVLQVMIGAAILAIPVGFTEETWNLGQTLPLLNVIGFLILSFFLWYIKYKIPLNI